jgi:hypothetical protein
MKQPGCDQQSGISESIFVFFVAKNGPVKQAKQANS